MRETEEGEERKMGGNREGSGEGRLQAVILSLGSVCIPPLSSLLTTASSYNLLLVLGGTGYIVFSLHYELLRLCHLYVTCIWHPA